MLKLALFGGLLVALSISGFSLVDLYLGLVGVGAALFALAIVIASVGQIGRRWDGHGFSIPLQRSRSAS